MLETAIVPVVNCEPVIGNPEWFPITGLQSFAMTMLAQKLVDKSNAVMIRESEEFPDCPVILLSCGNRLLRKYVVSARVQNLFGSGESQQNYDCQYFNLIGFKMASGSEHEPIDVDPAQQAYKGILQTVVDFRDYVVKLRLLMESMGAIDYFVGLMRAEGDGSVCRATVSHISMLGLSWRVKCGNYVFSCVGVVNGGADLRLHFNGRSKLLIWSGGLRDSWCSYDSEVGLSDVIPFVEPVPVFRGFFDDDVAYSSVGMAELVVSSVKVLDLVWVRGFEVFRQQDGGCSPYYLVRLDDFKMTILTDGEAYCEVKLNGAFVRFAPHSHGYKFGCFRKLSVVQRGLIVSCIGASMVNQFGT